MRMQQPGEAEQALQKLVATNPDQERPRLALARLYAVNGTVSKRPSRPIWPRCASSPTPCGPR